MAAQSILKIALSIVWLVAVAVWVAGVLMIAFLAVVLVWSRRQQARALSRMTCPHCNQEFGAVVARNAVKGKNNLPVPQVPGCRVYHVAEDRVLCSNCNLFSYWYPATLKLSPNLNGSKMSFDR